MIADNVIGVGEGPVHQINKKTNTLHRPFARPRVVRSWSMHVE